MLLVQGDYRKAIGYCSENMPEGYFEFELPYVKTSERFREIDRFLYESRHSLHFASEYRGNVVVDISEWNHKELNSYFDAFLYFLYDNREKYHCVLLLHEKCSEKLLNQIKALFDVREIQLQLPKESKAIRIGFTADAGTEEKNNVRS